MLRMSKLLLLLMCSNTAMALGDLRSIVDSAANVAKHCLYLEKSNALDFPQNEYFESLPSPYKVNVIIYLWKENSASCEKPAVDKLLKKLSELPELTSQPLIDIYSPTDNSEYIKGLNIEEIARIKAAFNQPFDGGALIRKLGI